ncbi:hypothetical protein H7K45_04370 [Mycobacterium yunnanensis]|uniref:Uncharacterized protein n=1 Tax=Mycobacterium yunnanensis TaxID=368477 RepID=A0A9X3BZD3_9MYCO|nr:hypothetical protein [Mycobacterium yunnanensis]MCV7419768.1 hypothetical protein [Mycobacterium yunnanensis]
MAGWVRSCLGLGVAAVTAAAVVGIAPTAVPRQPDVHPVQSQAAPRVDLAASERALVATPPDPGHFAAATTAMARLDPERTSAVVQAAPAPQNAASDAIVSGYQFLRYWVTYGVQLADYVLGFVPFGYAIADQVDIFYYNLILPISDSVVYNLIVPVVNDPLNLAAYVNGAIAVAQTSINAAINTGVAEFNYFFGWLIPPLPPRPLAAATEVTPVEEGPVSAEVQDVAARHDASATDAEPSPTPEPTKTVDPTKSPEPTQTVDPTKTPEPTQTVDPTKTPEPTQTVEPAKTVEPTQTPEPTTIETSSIQTTSASAPKPPTTTAAGAVAAQGEVRGPTTTTGTTTMTTRTTTTTTGTATTGTGTTSDPKISTATDTPASNPHTSGDDATGPSADGEN